MRHAGALTVAGLVFAALCLSAAPAQTQQGSAARQAPSSAHGDPRGWRFTLPASGDAARGRAVFEKFDCYKCHEVKGETFPPPSQRDAIGPELSSMGGHHSAGFLAESIMNPSAFIDTGTGLCLAGWDLQDAVLQRLDDRPGTGGRWWPF